MLRLEFEPTTWYYYELEKLCCCSKSWDSIISPTQALKHHFSNDREKRKTPEAYLHKFENYFLNALNEEGSMCVTHLHTLHTCRKAIIVDRRTECC
jgi:hypothetical protein